MAKESMKAKQRKKIHLADKYAEKRAELRKKANEGDWDAMMALQKLPKNSMKIRVHNRCGLTGRPKGYMRQFGISRVTFREMAVAGKIPGVTKASW
ncbi:MAG: 30S ribosomal protein S14 [Crocinitomicaceae bacterium]|nr:30S ribosomal protein S14 [Crocinitomicaceae bacterium]